MKTTLLITLAIVLILYIIVCGLLFLLQERMIFFPEKLDKDYRFTFDQAFEEIDITTRDGTVLNGLLFRSNTAKGVIFYLHGNAGSLASWGEVAKTYTDLNYDVFIVDYRGYGKSEGVITGQDQFFGDLQAAYDELKKKYIENDIVVLGYSIGTGPAAWIASKNNPRLLILQAPYYSLKDMLHHLYPIIPAFILKYKFKTNEYLRNCRMPVVLFHGTLDEVIYYGSSIKLQKHFKPKDTLITLEGQGHNGITDNEDYKLELRKLLGK